VSVPAVVIEVQCTAPGGAHLARHLQQRLEAVVLGEVVDLSDSEREGVRVTSWLTEDYPGEAPAE
jgi:hypothetical protein